MQRLWLTLCAVVIGTGCAGVVAATAGLVLRLASLLQRHGTHGVYIFRANYGIGDFSSSSAGILLFSISIRRNRCGWCWSS